MNENELLNIFLRGCPNSTGERDRQNFALYALECVKNDHYIDIEAMRKHGVTNEYAERYESAFGWIKIAYQMMNE